MAKSERLSTTDKVDGIDKAYASALKALSVLGIKMATKKPDNAKVGALMTKNKKPAAFMLSCDKATAQFSVECGSTSFELGKLTADVAKDGEKAVAVLKSLVECGLMSQGEMDKLTAGMKKGPDTKVAANEIRKKIAAIKKLLEPFEKITTWDAAKKDQVYFKELEAQLKTEHSSENAMFIAAVEKNFSRDKIMKAFIGDAAKFQVNLPAPIVRKLEDGGTDFGDAVTEIKKTVARDTMKRLKKRMETLYEKQISELDKELAKLG